MFDTSKAWPKISFGMIVLNGEPFLRYNLRALYPFAFEIIVVEGAVAAAAAIATKDGHSTDGTLQTLRDFKKFEDPENKVTIITKNGFWTEKDEQSQAYVVAARGDYLWQIDVDEFYQPEEMQTVIEMLVGRPQISAVSFIQLSFWGGFDYLADGWYLHQGGNHIHRLFRWGPDYKYISHRPPTVQDDQGRDLHSLYWINGFELSQKNIFMYHYHLIFPKQVQEKCRYYDAANWVKKNEMEQWAQENYRNLQNPFRVHNVYDYISWLERFEGRHPPQIQALITDMDQGKVKIETRKTEDVEILLQSPLYQIERAALKTLSPIRLAALNFGRWGKRKLRSTQSIER